MGPLAIALLLGRNGEAEVDGAVGIARESPHHHLLAKADGDSQRAYSRLRGTVMLATLFGSPAIRRKGQSVTALYRRALVEASSSPVREERWRRFIVATASLNQDLEGSARPAPNDAIRRAHDVLARIVDENADLLDDATPA
jgi:hypothetical protein